jgi:spore coat protein CotH
MTTRSAGFRWQLASLLFMAFVCLSPAGAAVVINEIMYHPASGNENEEYFELYNTGPGTVTFTGWRLSGVGYTFPAGKTLAANRYLVIAKSVAAFHARYPASTADVIGDYPGNLNNDGEQLTLYDAAASIVDAVHYRDNGYWPREADGDGSSLELINPYLDHSAAHSWAASLPGGTPGLLNSRYQADPAPFLVKPHHSPAVPHSTDPIAITVHAYDNSAVSSVTLFYRDDPSGGSFSQAVMLDDGGHGDGAAGDGIFGTVLPPPHPQGTIMEFWMRATDNTGHTTDIPTTAPIANFMLQVDNQDYSATSPTYRVVMKRDDDYLLHSRSILSDVLLNATFITGDEIYYNVGVRFRGKGSRGAVRKSYRVQFKNEEPFHGIENMNLNGSWIRSQFIDMDLFQRAGVPASDTQFAYLVFKYNDKNTYYRYDGTPATEPDLETMGWRVQVEDVDEDFLRNKFPGHSNGNLYRGTYPSGSSLSADFSYWGPDKELYRPYYDKHTNKAADDFSDVIRLCNIFTNTPDASFTPTVQQYIVPDEWMRFWAAHAVVNTDEYNITNVRGDEYFIYFDPATLPPIAKALLIPWDFQMNLSPTETIWKCTLPKVKRFCENPDFTPKYFYYIQEILDHTYTLDIMLPKIQALAPYHGWETSPATGIGRDTMTITEMTNYVRLRIAYLESVISRELTVNLVGAVNLGNEYLALQPTVTLNGRGVTAYTRWVTVNGHNANYQNLTGNWGDYVVNLNLGLNTVVVDCLTTAHAVVARKTFTIRYAGLPTTVCGTLSANTTWNSAGSPYVATCDVRVPAGRTLTIQPGTMVFLYPGCSILTSGTLLAQGTQQQPIYFGVMPAVSNTLIPRGAVWKYNDRGTDLGTAWRALTYNDSSWSVGPAQLGYGNDGEVTTLSYGPDANNKYPCYYFRRTFQVPDATAVTSLKLRVVRDDGCMIWLNNKTPEAVRSNMPSGTVTYNTWADRGLGDPEENQWVEYSVSPGYLVSGTNMIAVGVHQQNAQSSDVIFNLEMATSETAHWGVIGFNSADTTCRLSYCKLEHGSTASRGGRVYGGVVSIFNSSVDIQDCTFSDYSLNGVFATNGSGIVNVRRCTFDGGGLDAIYSNGYGLTVEGSTFAYRTLATGHAINLTGQSPASRISGNNFAGAAGTILSLESATATVDSNTIHLAADAGLILGAGSRGNVHHNVIYDCGRGIVVRNGAVGALDHNTLYGSAFGIQSRNEVGAPGAGYGTVTVTNTIIWSCIMAAAKDANSTIDMTYSDISGGYAGTGNFNLDPQFLNVPQRDFHIPATSPCQNRGVGRTYVGAFPPPTLPSAVQHWRDY